MATPSLQVIREYLIADTSAALYADVATRIDTIGNPDNTKPFIVMNRRGGADTDYRQTARPYVQFKVYGGRGKVTDNPSGVLKSQEVYENLKTRLHNVNGQSTTNGFIISAFESQPPQDLVEPDTNFPFVLAFYEVETRNKT